MAAVGEVAAHVGPREDRLADQRDVLVEGHVEADDATEGRPGELVLVGTDAVDLRLDVRHDDAGAEAEVERDADQLVAVLGVVHQRR